MPSTAAAAVVVAFVEARAAQPLLESTAPRPLEAETSKKMSVLFIVVTSSVLQEPLVMLGP